MKLSQKEKLSRYDSLSSDHDRLSLVLHDLVNDQFSKPVKIRINEVGFRDTDDGYFTLRVSERGLKLYLFCYHNKGQYTQTFVHDEIQVENARDTNTQY